MRPLAVPDFVAATDGQPPIHMVRAFKSSDEGKRVVTKDGDTVGKIRAVQGDEAHVEPERGLAESIRNRLGMGDKDDEMYVLKHDEVESISGNKVRLNH